jgi:hypothetical protein
MMPCFLAPSLYDQDSPKADVRRGISGIELDRPQEASYGAVRIRLQVGKAAQGEMGSWIVGVLGEKFTLIRDGGVQLRIQCRLYNLFSPKTHDKLGGQEKILRHFATVSFVSFAKKKRILKSHFPAHRASVHLQAGSYSPKKPADVLAAGSSA